MRLNSHHHSLKLLFGLVTTLFGIFEPISSWANQTNNFYWDHNLSFFVSRKGTDLAGLPFTHVAPSDQAPRNYFGFDWKGSFQSEGTQAESENSWKFTSWSFNPHLEVDVNPWENYAYIGIRDWNRNTQKEYRPDRAIRGSPVLPDAPPVDIGFKGLDINYGRNTIRLKPVINDAWIRIENQYKNRRQFTIGHILIPYGSDVAITPRFQGMMMPIESMDIGSKFDWGVSWRHDFSESYSYMFSMTSGIGLGMRDPGWISSESCCTYLFSGRIGTTNTTPVNYGLSFLYGSLPTLAADHLIQEDPLKKWRVAINIMDNRKQYTSFSAQVGIGRNEDSPMDLDPSNETVVTSQFNLTHNFYKIPRLGIKIDVDTILYDTRDSDDNLIQGILGLSYSITTGLTFNMDYLHRFQVPWGTGIPDQRIYFSLTYYQ